MYVLRYILLVSLVFIVLCGCGKGKTPNSVLPPNPDSNDFDNTNGSDNDSDNDNSAFLYPNVPQSDIYSVSIKQNNLSRGLVVFVSECPEYRAGYMGMLESYKNALDIFKGRSISWANFSFSGSMEVTVTIKSQSKVAMGGDVRILPSRFNIIPTVSGQTVTFTVTQPGQYSVEIGENGYKNGLMIFANPIETDIPDTTIENKYYVVRDATPGTILNIPAQYSGIYFARGIHNIDIYHVPNNIKNIYFDPESWVYGAIILDGNPNVKIWGRGVLSGNKINYKTSHSIEALNGSNNVQLEGITIANNRFFSVRFISNDNTVSWIKVIGGWTYNTDGIRVGANSIVSHCFVWANDDNIKVYRDNVTYSDIVCWQLNNGGAIQLGWGNNTANNVRIKNVDLLHGEWNSDAANRGVLSWVGDKFQEGNMSGAQTNLVIENLITETSVSLIINLKPEPFSPSILDKATFRNWNVKFDKDKGYHNYIVCGNPNNKFKGIVFDNFVLNGTELDASNWITVGSFQINNIEPPTFY